MMQVSSWTIPMTSIVPRQLIANMVDGASRFDGVINRDLREQYDGPIFEYARSLLEDTEKSIDSLYFVGHSLGGALSKIVAAQIYRFCLSLCREALLQNDSIHSVRPKKFEFCKMQKM